MFNRGFRRDDRNSFRSNANMSRGHNAPSLMSVSPWEGGVVPGSGGSSILGTPQLQGNQGGLTPQAQVLAQNLNILSNLGLLQPQLQSRQTQALPSLINLGSALNRTLGIGQQNTGYNNRGPGNRFQDRQKFGRQDGRRTDTFNKNRSRTGQSQASLPKLQSYRPLNSKITPLTSTRKLSNQDALAKARADVRGKRPRNDSTKSDSDADDAKKEEGEEVVKKRDWKKEKKTEVIEIADDNENVDKDKEKTDNDEQGDAKKDEDGSEAKEDGAEKEGEGKEDSTAETKKESDKNGKPAESVIYGCHVCSKIFADETMLSSHVRTASHKRQLDQLEEAYALKVKRLRDQMRIQEQQKEMDMNMRNRGRRTNMQHGHCKMCDLSFIGHITAHRKTPLHIKLKNYLHPNCLPCGKEFPARMEWDLHKLTPEHLKTVAGIDKKSKKLVGNGTGRSNEPNYARLVPRFPEGLDSAIANMDEEMADKTAADTDDGDEGTVKYDPTVVTGINMLVHGQHCGVCSKFFARRTDALGHCKTRSHFDNYLAMKAKLKAAAEEEAAKKEAEKKAKAEAEAEAKAKADADGEAEKGDARGNEKPADHSDLIEESKKKPVVCLKRTSTKEDEGNWKRSRKTEDDEENEEEDEDGDTTKTPVESENVGEGEDVAEATEDTDKYDPAQATSPETSSDLNRALDSTMELLDSVEQELEAADKESDKDTSTADVEEAESPVSKPANKARRGRKRK